MSSQPPVASFFFFNDTATTEIYTLSLHDALPISEPCDAAMLWTTEALTVAQLLRAAPHPLSQQEIADATAARLSFGPRSEEHTSELQSPCNLVCRLLLEKKKSDDPPAAAVIYPSA